MPDTSTDPINTPPERPLERTPQDRSSQERTLPENAFIRRWQYIEDQLHQASIGLHNDVLDLKKHRTRDGFIQQNGLMLVRYHALLTELIAVHFGLVDLGEEPQEEGANGSAPKATESANEAPSFDIAR